MRPLLALCLALPLAACSGSTPAPVAPADAASAQDLGATVDATVAPDVPARDVPVARDRGVVVDVPTLTYRALGDLSPVPIRRFDAAPEPALMAGYDYRALVETDVGAITLDLFEEATPVTVNSFVWLARNHYFDGIAFHRVIEGFVAQGGDPNTVDGGRPTWGRGGPGYSFGLEVTDDLRFDAPGVIGMARSASPTSNGSQFYLTLAPTPDLDGQYTVFGRVLGVADLGVLDRVARGEPPEAPTRITSVTILVGAR
ncbi:MAG: peptidylprolyl isomerase [Deltaproteobacteria bacterium]|nr:peptidylprolyl isomerase [Myxococcales bacterium]MDP3220009.1 peptidylprolyl isomerase [Deltaproteobacteria bacterium]